MSMPKAMFPGTLMGTMAREPLPKGPFRADQLSPGDPYELSKGHAIRCYPTGGRGAGPNALGASVVAWDPAVTEVGVDAGYSPEPGTLRAPDVSVGNVPPVRGWIPGAPPLAIEYADTGQDEDELQAKIADLLAAGTRYLWVARLVGPRRVEVFEPGKPMSVRMPGESLEAPGVLQNAVPVDALFDRDAAERATIRNLLQRRGYEDLDAVRREGRLEGREEGLREAIRDLCEVLGETMTEARVALLERSREDALLELRRRIKDERRWPAGAG